MQVVRLLVALGVALCLGAGCDRDDDAIAVVEETLREQAATEPKTGMLRALEVRHTAQRVAQRMAAPPNAACFLEIDDDAAFRYRWTLELTRRSAAGIEERWREVRILRRDDDGNVALRMDAGFVTELGLEGRRSPAWLVIGDDSFVSVDGSAYYQRSAGYAERARLLTAGRSTLQTLLDAVPGGWSRRGIDTEQDEQDAAVFRIGGGRLVCSAQAPSEAGWLRRFETRATPLSGELRISESPREGARQRAFEARWQLEDGSTLEAKFADRLIDGAEAIEPPPKEAIVDVERDRSLHKVERLLDEMAESGLIERASSSNTDSSDDEP